MFYKGSVNPFFVLYFRYNTGIRDTSTIKPNPITNIGDIFPFSKSRKELEKTINAMQAGNIQMNVVIA